MTTKNQPGFTLIELAMVLLIATLIGLGSTVLYTEHRAHSKWMESQSRLEVMKKALIHFAEQNHYLPCPDTNGNGFENRTGTQCSSSNGALPFNDLHMGVGDARDSWGYDIRYYVNLDTTTTAINNCPNNSACFYNNSAPPEFDLDTPPIKSDVGSGNLRVCNNQAATCVSGTVATQIEADNMIAVLVARNQNGGASTGLGVAEAENLDNDGFFMLADYQQTPFYDDWVVAVSASEIKQRFDNSTFMITPVTVGGGPTVITGDNIIYAGDGQTLGAIGDNDSHSENVQIAETTQDFDFGAENAGKTVVFTLDTRGEGTWDQGGTYTEDRAYIVANDTTIETMAYDKNDTPDGYVDFLDRKGTADTSDDELRNHKYWDDSREYTFELDENGQASIDFQVATTGTDEVVSFTNIVMTLFDTPPAVPDMPSVSPISGIPQTEGLE